jgi:hypothetical protein
MRRVAIAAIALGASLACGGALAASGRTRVAPQASGSQGPDTAAALSQDTMRLYGEYGLYVGRFGDTVDVRWLTRVPAGGSIRALAGSRVVHEATTTPSAGAHAVRFTHRGGGTLTLRYGSSGDAGDLNETTITLDPPRRARVAWPRADSLFVISDIHGEYDTLVAVLRNAGVIDGQNRWSARRAQLVVAGDMTDRGRDVTRLLWFLYSLEKQAEQAGGRVHVLLGNHEVMVMLADLRYVHGKELAIAHGHGISYDRLFDPRRSILGRWLASKPAVVRIGDLLLAHGGVSTEYLPYTLESFDDTLETYMGEELFYFWADTTVAIKMDSATYARRVNFFWDDRSVFWFRGYAQSDSLKPQLDSVLRRFDARTHVIGHTPGRGIRTRYDGNVIVVNTVPFGAEVLLLARRGDAWNRFRIRSTGPPERL